MLPVETQPLWEPSPARVSATRLAAFQAQTGARDYPSLHAWSVDAPDEFWSMVWHECGMIGDRGDPVLEPAAFAATRFFPDARLSVVENLLALRPGVDPDGDAIVAVDETGRRTARSWNELRADTAGMAAAMRAHGVRAGDRVAAWLPNGLEAVIVMLGAASIGAIYSSTSPDFGVEGVVDRFGQIEPIVLFAASSYPYGGKRFECGDRLAEIRPRLPSVKTAVMIGDAIAGTVAWDEFLHPYRQQPFEPERFAFDHPWYILYSSGTTGAPKCIVHRAGGVLIQHLKEHQLHCDVGPRDRVLYFTTTGWMMWNWLVSTLASGATAVFFDGSPFHPGPSALFDLVDRERLTLLGVSARYLESLRKSDFVPRDTHHLGTLRTICSTGSPLSPDGFRFVYDGVKHDVHLASISGGTDLCGCLVGGDPTGAVWAGEIQRPALGMAIDIVDPDGASLADTPGESGELVCRRPFPSMPLGFWNDDTGERYHHAYYARFEGIWAHGDYASFTPSGGVIIHGRSDTTLNPGGVRIGTAEIYRVVEALPEVEESLAFGQKWDDDVRVVLLVRLRDGRTLTDDLRAQIRARVRAACTPRHVPAVIAQVDDLPRTRSNKLVELAVADAVHGRIVRNTEAIANPEAIDAIVALPELHH